MKIIFVGLFLIASIFQSWGQQFSPSVQYVNDHRDKWTIELPEVQELVHIIIAISPTGISDSNMVDHTTAYYKKVLEHFGKYDKHKIVNIVLIIILKRILCPCKNGRMWILF
ncbi:MAG: hypothetical protein HC892_23155 [Saprospiraceae bacterium]|nr:hypothetical protein [Saprospiraceae bacterium]